MAKELVIPKIKGNPRLGKESENDASVRYGGAKIYSKSETVIAKEKPQRKRRTAKRKTKQKSITIKNTELLKSVAIACGITETAVLNVALAKFAKEII
jgi:hypothetical protein